MTVIDQMGRTFDLTASPQRIVSLVPSITELLCDFGLRERLVGCTKFCVHPADLRKSIQIVGGTKEVHLDRLQRLQPDLIIANKEENQKEQIATLQQLYPCWVSEIKTLADAEEMTRSLASIWGVEEQAEKIINANRSSLVTPVVSRGKALYLIWQKPYMSVGRDTYIHDMLTHCGYTNVCENQDRYPSLDTEEIQALTPDHILLSSEPFPFKEQHLADLKRLCPEAKVQLVDGEYYSWYGSRLGKLVKG